MAPRRNADVLMGLCLFALSEQVTLLPKKPQTSAMGAVNAFAASNSTHLRSGLPSTFFNTIRPCATCQRFERFGERNDGGYVMCADGLDHNVKGVLSYGVNGFDGWGMALANRFGAPLHEYDCFNPRVPTPCVGCKATFHHECLTHEGPNLDRGGHKVFKTMSQHLSDAGLANSGDRSLLLKVDIEGGEWDFFAHEPVESLKRVRQIVVEFHHIAYGAPWDKYTRAVHQIQAAGFAVAHLHGNNCCASNWIGNYQIPSVLEVTFVLAPSGGCTASGTPVRLALDSPNLPQNAEVPLHFPAP